MGLAAAINTAKSWGINKLTEENPNNLYIGKKPNGTEFFQCDLSDITWSNESENLRAYHQTNIYVTGLSGLIHPRNKYSDIDTFKISANLPQEFSYSFGGKWERPLEKYGFSSGQNLFAQGGSEIIANVASQLAGAFGVNGEMQASVENKISENFPSTALLSTTSLVWTGPKPMEIKLTIPVFDDRNEMKDHEKEGYKTDLREVLNLLGCLSLPEYNSNMTGFLTPPPSPLVIPGPLNTGLKLNRSCRTRVQVGGMFSMNQVALKDVSVSYKNTRSLVKQQDLFGNVYLSPLFATLSLTFETVLGVTSLDLQNMLWLQDPIYRRVMVNDIAKFGTEYVINEGTKLVSKAKDKFNDIKNKTLDKIGGLF